MTDSPALGYNESGDAMYICRIQHNWRGQAGTAISAPVKRYYNLFHFPTPVEIRVGEELIKTRPNACIISKPWEPRWFYFQEDTRMNWMHNDASIEVLLDKYEIPVGQVFYPENPGFLADSFRKMFQEFYSNAPHREELLDGYVEELLIKLSRSIREANTPVSLSSNERKQLVLLRLEMVDNPQRQWTVAQMAQRVSLSPSRFHAVYKALFDISPMADVINAKVDRAKTLLTMDEKAGVLEISEKLGYTNQYHFIRQFKAATGMTPGAYRKKNL